MTTTRPRTAAIARLRRRAAEVVREQRYVVTGDGNWCLVLPDGSVLVWDSVADHHTRCHDLSEAVCDEARAMTEVAS